ncbi:MAG: ABC transporter ATP-binding protein [Caldilineaceae bacterium]|nr:ABC transporter ATP-binding protein [Caldilineaceae bacterium]
MCGIQMLVGFFLAARMAIMGTISVGDFLVYSGLVIQLIWPIRNLGRLVAQMSTGIVSLERVQQIIRQEREPLDQGTYEAKDRVQGEIVYEHVYFAYETPASPADRAMAIATSAMQSDYSKNGHHDYDNSSVMNERISASLDREYVLQDINLRVSPGMVVGLLGATGSGKTSLVNLLPRFYEYTEGRILLDGVDLRDYRRSYLRAHIGIVQQEPFLFSTTIRANITYGLGREVSDEEVETAARAAAVHDVIMGFPKGYDTMVGERGVTLSGGQKQRVTIARTLLKNPSILILDDATSSVDTETDAEIRAALRNLMRDRTTFIIAHRVQSVMEADKIVVMDRGRIVQMGSHRELLEQQGIYRRVYDLQARIEAELEQEIADAVKNADAKMDNQQNGHGGLKQRV